MTPPLPWVYPRTGGGNAPGGIAPAPVSGLSPHGRGKPEPAARPVSRSWSIPARAGETGVIALKGSGTAVYPRTGGGNATASVPPPIFCGLSPHGRGKRVQLVEAASCPRSIPARAGETATDKGRPGRRAVYPRTGGGNLKP